MHRCIHAFDLSHPTISHATHEGDEKVEKGEAADVERMLPPASDHLVWRDGGNFMTTSDHFIPKELLLFDPSSPQYPAPIFFSQNQNHEQDKVAAEQISGGLNDPTNHDNIGMILDDSLTSKSHITNGHGHDHVCIKKAHGPLHHHDLHLQNHHDQQRLSSGYSNSNNPVRTCADCNTTKTPLWRSGPLGPKSLCNACGIRHHKARRAKAAAANGNRGFSPATNKLKKQKRADLKSAAHYKRKSKIFTTPHGRKNICFELDLNCEIEDENLEDTTTTDTLDFSAELSKGKPFKRVFPEDEEQAAILLMAFSCGLVHG